MWQNPRAEMSCKKEEGRKPKYKSFMYKDTTNVGHECMIISVITGATGIVTKRLKKTWKLDLEDVQ